MPEKIIEKHDVYPVELVQVPGIHNHINYNVRILGRVDIACQDRGSAANLYKDLTDPRLIAWILEI